MIPSFLRTTTRRQLTAALALAVPACGSSGTSVSAHDSGPGVDASHPRDAAMAHHDAGRDARSTPHDSGKDVSTKTDGGCVANPVAGAACDPEVVACHPATHCGPGWLCSEVGGKNVWVDEPGSKCVVEDAGPRDSGGDLDGGVTVSSCGKCGKQEMCIVTLTGGGDCVPGDSGPCPPGTSGTCCNITTTYTCHNVPGTCVDGVTCSCASSLCGEGYQNTCSLGGFDAGTTDPVIQCNEKAI